MPKAILKAMSNFEAALGWRKLQMLKTVAGTVRGKTIELAEDLGIPEGQAVEVTVQIAASQPVSGEGIRRSAGIASDVPEFEEALAEIQRDRSAASFRGSRNCDLKIG
ncbi:MAG: hypothetical protein KY475_18985 [Planctomycetes bacterium]|nr:hypothetical protein [Planctomycetota bacterium]